MEKYLKQKTTAPVIKRVDEAELLDLGQGTLQDVVENLAEMQRFNEVFGGNRALTRHLYPRLLLHNQPVTVVDLGTGGGGIPALLVGWARRLNIALRVIAVDWSDRILAVAQRNLCDLPEVSLLRADARYMPLLPGRVDYVISSLFLHHFSPEKVVIVLQRAFDLASVAIVMSDLVRGWLPYLGFKLVQPVFARNFLTRHDGSLSIRRAYTPGELHRLAVRAGLPNPQVISSWPWRMTLVVEK